LMGSKELNLVKTRFSAMIFKPNFSKIFFHSSLFLKLNVLLPPKKVIW
jgi:hypothetical protein